MMFVLIVVIVSSTTFGSCVALPNYATDYLPPASYGGEPITSTTIANLTMTAPTISTQTNKVSHIVSVDPIHVSLPPAEIGPIYEDGVMTSKYMLNNFFF